MNETAVTAILNYMEEYLFEPRINWPASEFNQRSYARWSANEILELIMDHPFTPPMMIIEEFTIKMLCCSNIATNEKVSIIFKIAMHTAEDILLLFV